VAESEKKLYRPVSRPRLIDFDATLEEAAMDLGASPLTTFRAVTLPLIAPAIVAGWMLAFALLLDDLILASFTTGPGATTLPMRIYAEVRLGVIPEMNAVCSVMIGVVALASVWVRRQSILPPVAGEIPR
jgi:putrescine transport system permease protein